MFCSYGMEDLKLQGKSQSSYDISSASGSGKYDLVQNEVGILKTLQSELNKAMQTKFVAAGGATHVLTWNENEVDALYSFLATEIQHYHSQRIVVIEEQINILHNQVWHRSKKRGGNNKQELCSSAKKLRSRVPSCNQCTKDSFARDGLSFKVCDKGGKKECSNTKCLVEDAVLRKIKEEKAKDQAIHSEEKTLGYDLAALWHTHAIHMCYTELAETPSWETLEDLEQCRNSSFFFQEAAKASEHYFFLNAASSEALCKTMCTYREDTPGQSCLSSSLGSPLRIKGSDDLHYGLVKPEDIMLKLEDVMTDKLHDEEFKQKLGEHVKGSLAAWKGTFM